MLCSLDTLHFRHQNDPHIYNTSFNNVFKNAKFLPANYYPVQTPGYSIQWTKERVEIIERFGETAKIVHELHLSELTRHDCSQIFNPIPKHERPRKSVKSGGSLFQNWTGWIYKKFTGTADQNDISGSLEIIDVIPLMFDETVFDSVVVIKKDDMVGFIRIRLLITGNLKNIQQFNDFIPALPIKADNLATLITWKHLIFAFDGVAITFINFNDRERSKWKAMLETEKAIEDICVCEDKASENRIILLLKSNTVYEILKFDLINLEAELMNRTIAAESFPVCGYIENDNLYVIQGQNLYEISLASFDVSVFLLHDNFQFIDSKLYLFPWRQDLKVSALLFYLTRSNDAQYRISIMSVIGTKSDIILESDWFENFFEIVSMFATSSLELFLLDEGGNVQIYSGLLLNTDWQWKHNKSLTVIFEFTHWFNILGEFPFKPVEYYNSRRLQVDDTLFIDDLMKLGIEFPPTNWKSLGHACRQLKDENIELILYYLFASGAGTTKLQSFYNQFGLKDRQVSAIELVFACDHEDYGRASNLFCTRKIEEEFRIKFTGKIVKFMKTSAEIEELTKFGLFAAGRIVSIDLLLEDESLMYGMLESILKSRDIPSALEWIKGLFAWLRPDDRCALIPVAVLHQTFIKRLLAIVLKCGDNMEFKRLGNEFVDAPFDPEMLRTILTFLSDDLNDSSSDRSAWLITMICAIRGRLHGYFLEFDFGAVKDEEVLRGIENIRRVIRGSSSVIGGENSFLADNNTPRTHTHTAYMSPARKHEPSVKTSPSQSQSPLLSVYTRTPSSPKSSPVRLPGRSSTFKPRHYPTKKPSTLNTRLEMERDEDDDPFKEDMKMFNGKRPRHEDTVRVFDTSDSSNYADVVILTKDEQVKSFESVITVVAEKKRKAKRRRT